MARRIAALLLLLLFSFECDARRKTLQPRNAIEDVDSKRLEELIETEEFLAVFFYTKVCADCQKILQELEKIDDDAENFGIQFVKNGEKFVARRYGVTDFPALVYFRNKEPAIYHGDLMNEDNVLAYLTDIESMVLPDAIEEVNAKVLQNIIDETEFVAVLFYKNDCQECDDVLHDLEEIDDDAEKSGIAFVKVSDEALALEFGLETLPALLYYRNKVPLLYDGNLHDENLVLTWLEAHKDLDTDVIEDISSTILPTLIENTTYLAVLFYDKNDEKSQTTLLDLEAIDDDTSKHGIPFVKIADLEVASLYGIVELPALVYFEKKIPNFYQGDLNHEEVLKWLIFQKESDEIEDVTNKVLTQMIKTTDYLAVLFYDSGSNASRTVLQELEGIDDDCDQHNIPFVKIDDSQLESLYGIKNPPALGFYKKQVPKFYDGDLTNEETVLQWLLEQMKAEEIEDVSTPVLHQMIKNTDFLSILFYDKNSEKSQAVIKELENIDDEADQRNLPFVKISDDELAKMYGIDDELPVLVYFENQIPCIYRGDLMKEEDVLDWLVKQMSSDEIEEVSDKLLDLMITKHDLLAVLFYDASSDTHILNELEKIDDEADQQGIVFLKTSDLAAAEKYGIEYLPALVFFYRQMPNLYSGDISDEDEVLEWFVNQLTKDEIEDVTEKMLLHLVKTSPALAVLFYDADSAISSVVLKELENIDDDTEQYSIPFVKISDYSLAQQFGLNDELPILVYFENQIPSIYEGDLTKEEDVLAWLIKQKTEDSIEEVTEEILLTLIKERGYVLTFFAPNNCTICEAILHELENIDDETDQHGILLVTTDDMNVAMNKANVTEFPALVLFRNEEPVVYQGDLMEEGKILEWVTREETLDSPDAIEEVNIRMLENLLNTSHSVAVLFYSKIDCPLCDEVLQSLENIDDDAEQNDVDFVKVSDTNIAEIYNVTKFPTMLFFRKQTPFVYEGDLKKPDALLQWLIENRDRPDSFIEDVDRRQLEVLLEEQTVGVFFSRGAPNSPSKPQPNNSLPPFWSEQPEEELPPTQPASPKDFEFLTSLVQATVPTAICRNEGIPTPPLEALEATIVQIHIPNCPPIAVASCYMPPRQGPAFISDLRKLSGVANNLIIAGDLNARHRSWDCVTANNYGDKLKIWAQDARIQIIAPNTPTHYQFPGGLGAPSIIDLALFKNIPVDYSIETWSPGSLPGKSKLMSQKVPPQFSFPERGMSIVNSLHSDYLKKMYPGWNPTNIWELYLDAKLLWNTHINYAISKARTTRTQLMSLLKRTSNLSLNNKILLYKSTILPILTYAAVVWSTAANSHLKKIQVFQSVTLRILTNAHYFVRNEVLHNDLKILPLDAFFRQNLAKFFNRLTQIENPVLHSLPAYDPAEPSSAKRPRSVLDRTYNIFPRKPKRRCLLD
ncbi:uncharacterized protein LOC118197552 [Stegodyphus dumicola]|uniref:uncharacterized protein LOC118197552 n=1 Tax=Stegodyphus dumicola TaxID=202533 RepID=UPI0015AF5023|nr:uncharacterized protein LOC118197552 [Stegodyphus dumicola]